MAGTHRCCYTKNQHSSAQIILLSILVCAHRLAPLLEWRRRRPWHWWSPLDPITTRRNRKRTVSQPWINGKITRKLMNSFHRKTRSPEASPPFCFANLALTNPHGVLCYFCDTKVSTQTSVYHKSPDSRTVTALSVCSTYWGWGQTDRALKSQD